MFPGAWKKARLVPLKKKSIPLTVSDFHPIALLSFLSKVLEKIVHEQISDFIDSMKILDPNQTGFRQHYSTQTALLSLSENIRLGIDRKKQLLTILLLFDFSKVFDKISPSKLLHKLIRMGFSKSAVLWIKSYITGRNQKVVTSSNGESDWLATNLGVPQGSVLGPLLFSLYINDIQHMLAAFKKPNYRLTNGVEHLLYADDLQIYTQVTRDNLSKGINRLSDVARAVSTWASENALCLNVEKTKANLIINILKGVKLPGIEVRDGVFVPFVDTVTNLGVVMDSKLTWKPQVDAITHKVNRALYGFKSFRSCTTEAVRKQLASALVVSHLDYCSLVYLDVTNDLQTRLDRLQNSCVRYICGARKGEHITPYRRKLGWLKLPARREYYAAILIYKIICMKQPPYLVPVFKINQHRTSSRDPKNLEIPEARTDTGLNSFWVQGVRLWHSIPRRIINLPSLKKFKLAIREHVLETN